MVELLAVNSTLAELYLEGWRYNDYNAYDSSDEDFWVEDSEDEDQTRTVEENVAFNFGSALRSCPADYPRH